MAEESTSKVRFRLTKKKTIFILIILAIPALFLLFNQYAYPITTWNYYGSPVGFRVNLRAAQKIPIVSTDTTAKDLDEAVREVLTRADVTNITFVFVPTDDKGNALYILEETELIKALTLSYTTLLPQGFQSNIPSFDAQAASSYANITASQVHPKIVLVHPNFGNETVVKQDGYIVYVEAKNTGNFNNNKYQFDLATERLMIALLRIKIQ